ncbi:CCR4-NOT transcription complex subunit 6-like isoform X4 [Rhipicephalus sanguineus]|uniref:CCR4-NOT transcription complex subunit 6-like isoform X4 n=1 Tax=Rhipicephalus sanguineus TaxID=34632 RepID=UPI00189536EA|nr:CCR4-NOT transcription complex subunit 6-like isoform X4 [Rhipicephalus sanguineus]
MRVSVGPERLLGACLIAKPPRPAWAGVPLIALPPSPPLDEQIVSLSQLALHAQGSPLVLAPRGRKPLATADEPTPPSTPDSALAADEAQAPLPRVLKPRKRRKRERAASAPGGPGPPTAPSALCACALCCRAAAYPTPPVSPLRDWDDFRFTASQPPQRPWVQVRHSMRSQPSTAFTVMCYNVLCDKYATRQVYGYCPAWALNWEYRRKGIMDEIRHYSADIISLQEVETEQFHEFFLPELKRDGYDGIFSPKSRAKTMSESDRKHVDGCAIFFRTSKFALIKEHLVEFNQLAMANADGSDDMLNRVMTKDNIGLAALLQFREGILENANPEHKSLLQQQPPLLVCTAHIHWDPEYCDVKLIQTMMLMRELRTIVDDAVQLLRAGSLGGLHRRAVLDTSSIPLLLCGDMNSLPDSGVIEFLKTGHVSADHPDFKELGYKDCLRKMCLESDSLIGGSYTHPFEMKEAYADGIMPYTNFTFDFKGVIDYIFFTRQHMSVLGVLGPLDPQWLLENKVVGCPHPHVPSDHLPLLAQLEMALVTNGLVQRR